MDSMWLEVILNVKAEEMDALCATLIANGVPGLAVEEEEEFRVVRTKRFPLKPMTVDEAILQMELLEHAFFAFKNEDSGAFAVVYKRNDGGYGLIEDAD